MKPLIFVLLFFCITTFSYSQHSLGIRAGMGINDQENPREHIIFLVPSLELRYTFQKSEKVSYVTGLGLSYQYFLSPFVDMNDPSVGFRDSYLQLRIPVQYRYFFKNWWYVGGGLNNIIAINSGEYEPLYDGKYPNRSFLLEAVGATGVQLKIWKISWQLGLFAELPINNREYFNLGVETGLYYRF